MNVFSTIWNGICAVINWLLQWLYGFTGNYGVAIILLTIIAKIVLLPMTIKQTRSMIAMQKIQPEIKKLQEKYKDDKERLSQEMMKFYKENKVNPLGGCLPLIVQFPVFLALFTVLRKYLLTPPTMIIGNTYSVFSGLPSYNAAYTVSGVSGSLPYVKQTGFLWISNLADTVRYADKFFVLIILLMLTTWYSQKQVMTDPRQKSMMYIMPLFMGFIALSFPAGVVLYWVTTNVLQILQQLAMEYYDKKHPREDTRKVEEKKTVGAKSTAKGGTASKGQLIANAKGKEKERPGAKQAAGTSAGKPTKSAPPSKAGQSGQQTPAKPKDRKQDQRSQAGMKKGPTSGGGSRAAQTRKPKGPPPRQGKTPQGSKKGKK